MTRVTVREVVGEEGEARPVQLSLRREGTVGRGTFGLVERVVVVRGQAAGAELAMKTVAVRRRDSRELRILRLAITILQVILKPNILYDVQPAASPQHCKSAVFLLLAVPGRGGQPAQPSLPPPAPHPLPGHRRAGGAGAAVDRGGGGAALYIAVLCTGLYYRWGGWAGSSGPDWLTFTTAR